MTDIEKLSQGLKVMVERICRESRFYTYNAWWHCLHTAEKAQMLAEKVGADPTVAYLGGLLHDIGSIAHGQEDHHLTGAGMTISLLVALNCPEEKINPIALCVFAHRANPNYPTPRDSLEAKCVASADALDHLEKIPRLLFVAFQQGMDEEEAVKSVKAKIERSWRKLMPEAKEIGRESYEAARRILGS